VFGPSIASAITVSPSRIARYRNLAILYLFHGIINTLSAVPLEEHKIMKIKLVREVYKLCLLCAPLILT